MPTDGSALHWGHGRIYFSPSAIRCKVNVSKDARHDKKFGFKDEASKKAAFARAIAAIRAAA